MSIDAALQTIKKGQLSPIYVLYGTQKFLMDECIKLLSQQALDSDTIDFNFERFDLQDTPVQSVVEAAETMPFMSDRRLIIAGDAAFLTGSKASSKIEHDLKSLETFIHNPTDYSILVLLVHHDKLDERKKVVKALKKNGTLIPCSALKEEQLYPWLKERAEHLRVMLDDDAAALLVQFAGNHMQVLTKELEKMAHFVGENGQITVPIVQKMVVKSVEHDVFTLIDNMVKLRFQEAYTTLQELLKRNEEPIKILFLLARQFRIMMRAKELDRKGYTQYQMSQIIGVPPFVCKLALQQGQSFSHQQLINTLDRIAEADFQMKTGQKDRTLILQMLMLQLQEGK